MDQGKRILKYRKLCGMTQAQLAEACGLTDSAIRNYELGNRTPGAAQVASIASALSVSPEALSATNVTSAREALELLFRVEEVFGLRPVKKNGAEVVFVLDRKAEGAQKLDMALKAWVSASKNLQEGKLTPEEYDAWKSSFGA